jgi:tetratricopeptide (TPR) repeat protein
MADSSADPAAPATLTVAPPPEGAAPRGQDAKRAAVGAAPQPSVDPQHPWLGLASFTEETRAYFYGREEEVAELDRRVQRKTLTVLFGQSGLGKTSILRAGLVPRLRPMGYCPVYVRIDYSRDSPPPSDQIKAAIFRATQESGQWTQPGVAVTGESLWEFLHHRDDILRDASGKTVIPLLIFDQFEEIFTLAQGDDFGRQRAAQFIEDLADLVENRAPESLEARIELDDSATERFDFTRSDYRILIALREDYLAHLEAFKGEMPSITQNRMRLARMTGEQALAAVSKPGGKLVSAEVAEAIVRFIAGGSELRNAEVEPSLLSLICRELNNARIAQGRAEISADLLAGSHGTILAEFYERALADQPLAVRHFIEDELLTESGFRESIAEESVRKAFAAAGARPDALAVLVDRRLLRIEERLDVRRVELTHDVLCSVVRASRDLRHEREARDEAERKLATQRARELATRKALVRARQIAAVCAVLAIGALTGAVFGYYSMKRAQLAEAQAVQTRAMAESARGEAEKLIVYLLDDFYLELEPVGRLDILAQLSKRAVDYYSALPAALRTSETDRNRALALVRYGSVLRTQSKLDESQKALAEAVGVLDKMRHEGDQSEITANGLSLGLVSQARVADSLNQFPQAQQLATQAVDTLRPLMAIPHPSIPLLRAYGLAITYLGFSQLRRNEPEAAVKSLEEAREAYRSIAGLQLSDLPSAAGFAEASAWQVEALQELGRIDEARRVGEEGAKVAGQVVDKRPGHMVAIRARALISDSLASSELNSLHLNKAIALSEAGARDWKAILQIDPSNQIAWNNLGSSMTGTGYYLLRMGRLRESQQQWRSALAIEQQAQPSAMIGSMLSLPAAGLGILEADLGERQPAQTDFATYARLNAMAVRDLPADSFVRAALEQFGPFGLGIVARYALPLGAGDYVTVRDLAQAAVQQAQALKPKDALQEFIKNNGLARTYAILADASYNLKDYAAADEQIKLAIDYRRRLPERTLQDQLDANDDLTLAALIAVRLERPAEAQRTIEPVVKFHRGLKTRDHDDLSQHVQLARALYVSALATPEQRTAELAEAASLIDGLPPMMRRQTSVALWRDRIAEEQKKRR